MRTVLIAAFVAFVLYASGLLVVLTPLPFLYVYVVRGRRDASYTVALSLAAVIAVYAVFFPDNGGWPSSAGAYLPIPWLGLVDFLPPVFLKVLGVGYFLSFAALAVSLGEGVRRKWEIIRWGGTALAVTVGIFFFMGLVAALVAGTGVVSGVERYFGYVVDEVVKVNQAADMGGAPLDFLAGHKPAIVAFIIRAIPSIVFVFALMAVVLNIIVSRRIIKAHHHFSHIHNVARFRMPDGAIWFLVLSGVAFFFNLYIYRTGWVAAFAVNGLIAVAALYFLQGMAVVVYFLQGIRLPLLKALAYVAIVLFFQTVSVMIMAIGVADVWVDFRLRRWRAHHHIS